MLQQKSFLTTKYLLVFLFFALTGVTACLRDTQKLISFLYHVTATFRTFLIRRLRPGHEITIWISNTAIVKSALFRLAQNNILAAFRACNTDLLVVCLCVPTLRESRSRKELSMRTIFDYHHTSTLIARHIRYLICNLDRFQRFLCFLHRLCKIRIEIPDNNLPL